MNIELYNNTFFSVTGQQMITPRSDKPSTSIDQLAFTPHTAPTFPSIKELFKSSNHKIPEPEIQRHTTESTNTLQINDTLHAKIFFIQYTPENTFKRRWYLIQIDIPSTIEINPDYLQNRNLWCIFLAKHPSDCNKSDEFSRWWPDWYRYSTCTKTNTIIFGDRFLIRPNSNPPSDKYIQWATLINFPKNNFRY